ncbi:MAG: PTS sugar transporter subunit IIC [Tissierellia bacterium]|nr:PTS sugar transporter subunit IIC [Tissierellia bacterium]
MTLFGKSILLGIWAGLCMLDQYGPHIGFRKPLLASIGVGIITGDVQTAIIIGATLELMWLGVNNIGAYVPPDVISGTVSGAGIGILSGSDTSGAVATAIAVAVPVSLLVQQIHLLIMTLNITILHKADKVADQGDPTKLAPLHYFGALMFFLSRAIPVFLGIYFGATYIQGVLDMIPETILNGLTVASKIIPAVGLAMLLTLMLNDFKMIIFVVAGFVFNAYLQLPILACALLGIVFAGIFDAIKFDKKEKAISNNANYIETEEEEYDL